MTAKLTARRAQVLAHVAEHSAWPAKTHSDIRSALFFAELVVLVDGAPVITDAGRAALAPADTEVPADAPVEVVPDLPVIEELPEGLLPTVEPTDVEDVEDVEPVEGDGVSRQERDALVLAVRQAVVAAVAAAGDAESIASLRAACEAALAVYAVPSLNIVSGVGRPALVALRRPGTDEDKAAALATFIQRKSTAQAAAALKIPGAVVEYLLGHGDAVVTSALNEARRVTAGRGFYLVATLPAGARDRAVLLKRLGALADAAGTSSEAAPVKVAADILARRVQDVA